MGTKCARAKAVSARLARLMKREAESVQKAVRSLGDSFPGRDDQLDAVRHVARRLCRGELEYDPKAWPFDSWLVYMASFVLMSRQRADQQPSMLRIDGEGMAELSTDTLEEQKAEESERAWVDPAKDILVRALKMIPPRERNVLVMCVGKRYSYARAARPLRLTPRKVQTALERGLPHLRAAYLKLGGKPPPRWNGQTSMRKSYGKRARRKVHHTA